MDFVLLIKIGYDTGASNMSKKLKNLPQQNPLKLEPLCKLTPGKQEIIEVGKRRRIFWSTKYKGTVDRRLKSSYTTIRNKQPSDFQCERPINIKILAWAETTR